MKNADVAELIKVLRDEVAALRLEVAMLRTSHSAPSYSPPQYWVPPRPVWSVTSANPGRCLQS